MILSLLSLIIFVVQHTIFGAFDVVKVTALDCPDEEQPGTGSDAEREDNQNND
jgi:hypothetical protein